jgi:hypothetical protein
MTEKICKINPIRGEVYENGIQWVLPCGVKYTDRHEVHCVKYKERTCEYLALNHINQQQIEEYLLSDMVV